MRFVSYDRIVEIIRTNPGIATPDLAVRAYPDIWPESYNFYNARNRLYHQLQILLKNGRIVRTGYVPGTTHTSTWEAVA